MDIFDRVGFLQYFNNFTFFKNVVFSVLFYGQNKKTKSGVVIWSYYMCLQIWKLHDIVSNIDRLVSCLPKNKNKYKYHFDK